MNNYLENLQSSDIRDLYQRDDGPEIILGHVRHVLSDWSADPRTDKGRKEIKAMKRKISRLKARFERERKAMTNGIRSQLDKIYARSRRLSDELDMIRDDVYQPVAEFESHMAQAAREWIRGGYAHTSHADLVRQAQQDWADAEVKPSAPGVADIAEVVDTDRAEIRDDILQDIVCLSAEQIVDKILAGDVRHVRVEL